MRKLILGLLAVANVLPVATAAEADTVRGKIIRTEGHISPNCRIVMLRRNDNGQIMVFRIASTGQEDGVLAVTLTALTTALDVEITFSPSVTTGCGGEPRIEYISIFSNG